MASIGETRRSPRWSRVKLGVVVTVLLVVSGVQTAVHLASADVIIVTLPGCVVDPGDLVAWWKGENDLTAQIGPNLTGSVPFGDGLIGEAMIFDGTNTTYANPFPTLSGPLTVEMWVKPVHTDRMQTLMSRWDFPSADDSARAYVLMLAPNGHLLWSTDETSTRRPDELSGPVPPPLDIFDGQYHHIAATWDTSQMVVYFDGSPALSKPSQGGALNPASTTQFRLGSKAGLGDPFF